MCTNLLHQRPSLPSDRPAILRSTMNTEETTSSLSPGEARVLGVLIEKAYTVPGQYPLTLNSLTAGCNQKSNRNPVMALTDDDVLDLLETLQAKKFTRTVLLEGSRVAKYRQVVKEVLDLDTRELVVLAELLLRGPQSMGELRTRASRMHKLADLDLVRNLLGSMMQRQAGPLVTRLDPATGSRAERYAQLIAPDAHVLDSSDDSPSLGRTTTATKLKTLESRVDTLESQLAEMSTALTALSGSLGEPSPLQESAEPTC